MNRRESMTKRGINNTNNLQKKYRLGTVSKNILLEGPFEWRFAGGRIVARDCMLACNGMTPDLLMFKLLDSCPIYIESHRC